jgi:undecaprenyl diphosphate synthase
MYQSKSDFIIADDQLKHIAFIMDGNGRWAKKRKLPREIGHKYGSETLRRVVDYCTKSGIKIVTVYAFSTENWKRPQKEVDSIIKLLNNYLDECIKDVDKNDISYRFIGDISVLDNTVKEKIKISEEKSKGRSNILNIAFNYGGRSELAHAFNELISENRTSISESDIDAKLYTSGYPDPDLLIRTGGEKRLSNFLLWQSSYSELYFTDVLWPDFSMNDLQEAIKDFYSRKRRYGGICD